MQTIIITSEKDRRYSASFGGKPIGMVYYPKWYSQDGEITIGTSSYMIKGRGFWKAHTEILKDGKPLYEIKNTWRGTFISRAKEPHHFYTLKRKGWFKTVYILESYKGEAIMEIEAKYSWKRFSSGYTIILSNDDITEENLLLLFIGMHCFRANQKQNAAVASSV